MPKKVKIEKTFFGRHATLEVRNAKIGHFDTQTLGCQNHEDMTSDKWLRRRLLTSKTPRLTCLRTSKAQRFDVSDMPSWTPSDVKTPTFDV